MSKELHVTINPKYKDRLFYRLFGSKEHPEWTLSLYNAINNSSYTDVNTIEFNTLEDALYLGMKNDVSFIIQEFLCVFEHQLCKALHN
ncbi:hypothetical protein [Butyrivibrio sp. NC2002]|uniref:hypothetical protein n=1 Tax=Butyrivibrio sp. NC2002 TaxID=1410610 RepID=UPI00055B8121|nr:hypothetical protein [Butyrivibrio sp. NC2002]